MSADHQRVFSTGDRWTFEEVSPGVYRRVYTMAEQGYFEPKRSRLDVDGPREVGGSAAVPPTEQAAVIATFAEMLRAATADGGRKRRAGLKPPWWRDPAHEPAIWSHMDAWKHGHRRDPDSGAHPLVHLAWRALAIAYQETHGQVDPEAGRGRALTPEQVRYLDAADERRQR